MAGEKIKTIELEFDPKKQDCNFRAIKYLYDNQEFATKYQYDNEFEIISENICRAKFSKKQFSKKSIISPLERSQKNLAHSRKQRSQDRGLLQNNSSQQLLEFPVEPKKLTKNAVIDQLQDRIIESYKIEISSYKSFDIAFETLKNKILDLAKLKDSIQQQKNEIKTHYSTIIEKQEQQMEDLNKELEELIVVNQEQFEVNEEAENQKQQEEKQSKEIEDINQDTENLQTVIKLLKNEKLELKNSIAQEKEKTKESISKQYQINQSIKEKEEENIQIIEQNELYASELDQMQKQTDEIQNSVDFIQEEIEAVTAKLDEGLKKQQELIKEIEKLDKELGKSEKQNDVFVEETKKKQLATSQHYQKGMELTQQLQGLDKTYKQLKSTQKEMGLQELNGENATLLEKNIQLKKQQKYLKKQNEDELTKNNQINYLLKNLKNSRSQKSSLDFRYSQHSTINSSEKSPKREKVKKPLVQECPLQIQILQQISPNI